MHSLRGELWFFEIDLIIDRFIITSFDKQESLFVGQAGLKVEREILDFIFNLARSRARVLFLRSERSCERTGGQKCLLLSLRRIRLSYSGHTNSCYRTEVCTYSRTGNCSETCSKFSRREKQKKEKGYTVHIVL